MTALTYDLHKLTALLDRVADGLLREHEAVSYSRFLALFAVQETSGSQRDVARWLGLTEPSTSRMVAVLAEEGLLRATKTTGAGNRRRLQLTEEGAAVVARCAALLESRFESLVQRSGVSYNAYQRQTKRLLEELSAEQVLLLPRRAG